MSDDEGKAELHRGLRRVKKFAEDHGVTICLELLNSKIDHKDYQCDHTPVGRGRDEGRGFAAGQTAL